MSRLPFTSSLDAVIAALVQDPQRNWRTLGLTGGPCAGKSSAQGQLHAACGAEQIRVLFVPEVASMLISGGVQDIGEIIAERPELFVELQRHGMFGMARALYDQYVRIAESFAPERVLIVFDRTELDVAAYIGADAFAGLIDEAGTSLAATWARYDAIVHMVSAAVGAEAHYTTANNTARRETAAEARELDARTLDAMRGHPNLIVADNRGSFTDKLAVVSDVALGLFDAEPGAGVRGLSGAGAAN